MKHAVLVVAHAQLELLAELAARLDDDFVLFVHVDRKTFLPPAVGESLRSSGRVRLVGQRFRVNWGGRSIVDAVLWLCRAALTDPVGAACRYFHLVSGADLPVRSCERFKRFFEEHDGRNFMEYFRLPDARWYGDGLDRLLYRHPTDRIDWQRPLASKVYERYVDWQRKRGLRRSLPPFPLYGGATWWSLTREAVAYLFTHAADGGWYDRLADTFAPDELFAQTVLLNSCLKGTVVNDSLRYVAWEERDGHLPALLDERDLPDIAASTALFARKIDAAASRRLMTLLPLRD